MNNQTRATILVGLNVLIWSINPSIFKLLTTILTAEQTISLGMGIAAFVFLFGLTEKKEDRITRLPMRNLCLSFLQGCILFLYYQSFFSANTYLSPQFIVPVTVTWCLVVALLSPIFFRQTVSRAEFFWIIFAYAGVPVSLLGAEKLGPIQPIGFVYAAACSILFALYWVLNTRNDIPQNQNYFICFTVAALLATGLLLSKGMTFSLEPLALAGCAYVGVFELTLPYILLGRAFRIADSVSTLATMELAIPFLALVWIHFFLHEPIAWTTLVSLGIIITGVTMQKRVAARHAQVKEI